MLRAPVASKEFKVFLTFLWLSNEYVLKAYCVPGTTAPGNPEGAGPALGELPILLGRQVRKQALSIM